MERGNYDMLVDFIAASSGLNIEEVEKRVQSKILKLSGLISKEGAAQIVAAELGINFDKQKIKISQIVPGMKRINVVGKIITLSPVREFNKNGRSGRVINFVLADNTNNIRTVLWDENHIELIIRNEICEGDCVEISNGGLRNGELHLTSFSDIKKSKEILNEVVIQKPVMKKKISEFNTNDSIATRAVIVQIFEPKFFNTCSECNKKVNEMNECIVHGRVAPKRRVLLGVVLDDGTETIRAVIFSDELKKIIPENELENFEMFQMRKKDILGKEMIIHGQVRRNSMFDRNEFIINEIKEVDIDKLIEELEKS